MIVATLRMALKEIRRNALRSFLTMLGVVIGVGAVIALVSLGRAATVQVTAEIGKLGKNLLTVSPGVFRRGGQGQTAPPLEIADAEAIVREIPGVGAVSPTAGRSALVVFGNENWRSTVTGADAAYVEIRGYEVAAGRLFNESEASGARAACVIGATVKKELFGRGDAVGAQVRVERVACEVVGVLAEKGQSGMGMDQDDVVVMPLSAFHRRLAGNTDVGAIFVSAAEGRSTTLVKDQLERLMRQRRGIRPGAEDNFSVRDMREIAQAMASATGVLTALLGAIAAVSLLVGGIGIMNIMLVSVTERTREIGLRLAIGALSREVQLQFLTEAVVLSTLGGLVGIVLGLLGSFLGGKAMGMPFVLVPEVLVLAFGFSALVGVVFGFLPARKAARLDPIEALRHE